MTADSTNKKPTVTASEEHALKDQFIAEMVQELVIAGQDTPDAVRIARFMRDDVTVTPKFGGHEVRLTTDEGSRLRAPEAVKVVQARVALLAFGPDPVPLLAERLRKLGIPESDARTLAEGRVYRLEDGRVAAGGVYDGGPEPDRTREYTDAEIARFRDPNEALTRATRAILAARNGTSPRANVTSAHDRVSTAF